MTESRAEFMTLLHDVARLHRVAADKRARRHDMTRAQWIILARLERQPGLSQKELAELLEVEPITVARLIDRLEKSGMVERRPDSRDRRIWRLHLRPEAAPVLEEIHVERCELAALATASLDDATVQKMSAAMAVLRTALCGEARTRGRPESVAPENGSNEGVAELGESRKVA